MKKFKSIKLHQDVLNEVQSRGWHASTGLYETGASDYIRIDFHMVDPAGEVKGNLLWSSFNGIFFGQLEDGTKFDNGSKQLDGQWWYDQLLDLFYETEELGEVVS